MADKLSWRYPVPLLVYQCLPFSNSLSIYEDGKSRKRGPPLLEGLCAMFPAIFASNICTTLYQYRLLPPLYHLCTPVVPLYHSKTVPLLYHLYHRLGLLCVQLTTDSSYYIGATI